MKLKLVILAFLIAALHATAATVEEERQCPAKVPLSNIVYPWPHPHWPEVHVYWQYDMRVQIIQHSFNNNQSSFEGLQEIQVRVDGINQKSRQDVYMKEDGSNEWELKHLVIADYKHSTIMEMQ